MLQLARSPLLFETALPLISREDLKKLTKERPGWWRRKLPKGTASALQRQLQKASYGAQEKQKQEEGKSLFSRVFCETL